MDRSTERIYKRKCFHGQGVLARWLDRILISLLGASCLFILKSDLVLSTLLFSALLLLSALHSAKTWCRYKERIWQEKTKQLKREDWLIKEADRIRKAGGIVLYPTPDHDAFTGLCLRLGPGTVFHCFGDKKEDMIVRAESLQCAVTFHTWEEGRMPNRIQVENRIKTDAPKPNSTPWRRLPYLPGNRYLMTGCLLLLMSIVLKRALYWRMLGSVSLLIGTIQRFFRQAEKK